jgi:hypothetical protein
MDQQRHTAEPSHLAQLRKFLERGKLKHHPDYRAGVEMADMLKVLNDTEHFVFTAVPVIDEEIIASAEAMVQAGVWRLPYPICTFEFSARLTLQQKITFNGDTFRIITLCRTHPDGEPDIVAAFVRAKDGHWIRMIWGYPQDDGTISYRVRPRRIEQTAEPVIDGTIDVHLTTEAGEATDIMNVVASCLVMLRTRGIRREKWCGNKPILLNRPEPANAYTRVMVAEAAEAGHGHTVDGVRYRVRLHLRRGHQRNQPHGPGRRYTRQIWIEPCLVGYEDEGRITHEHYEAYPQETAP